MEYKLDNKTYSLSYKELRSLYEDFCKKSDTMFLKDIAKAIHLACIISYVKELSIKETLSDVGIVHQLVHLMALDREPMIDLKEIREQFESVLKLA